MELHAHPVDAGGPAVRRRLHARAARDAWEALLRELAPSERPVLLPAYVGWSPLEGSGLFDPVRRTGIGWGFYPLDDRLRVDVAALEAMLEEREPAAVVVVHWFGFPEPATLRVAEACRDRGALLVEDCCHGLGGRVGDRPFGELGDFALVSLHKILPSRGGGFLQANGGRPLPPGVPPEAEISRADLAVLADADLEEAARRRRRNYGALAERLEAVPGVRPFHDALPEGAVPLNFPLLVEEADRFEVYKAMRTRGVGVVALYHTLVDALQPGEFPEAFRLSGRILNLPLHQELEEEELDRVVRSLAEALEEVGGARSVGGAASTGLGKP